MFPFVGALTDVVERRRFAALPAPTAAASPPEDGAGLLTVLGHLIGLALLVLFAPAGLTSAPLDGDLRGRPS